MKWGGGREGGGNYQQQCSLRSSHRPSSNEFFTGSAAAFLRYIKYFLGDPPVFRSQGPLSPHCRHASLELCHHVPQSYAFTTIYSSVCISVYIYCFGYVYKPLVDLCSNFFSGIYLYFIRNIATFLRPMTHSATYTKNPMQQSRVCGSTHFEAPRLRTRVRCMRRRQQRRAMRLMSHVSLPVSKAASAESSTIARPSGT